MDEIKVKTVLLLGDSIRQNYQEYVKERLNNIMNVIYTRDNGRFCQYTLRYLHEWVNALTNNRGEAIDIVHFNCGLWDVLRLSNESGPFTNEKLYEDLLKRIYDRIRFLCPKAVIIYALTTEVIEPGFEPGAEFGCRCNKDIARYNEIAWNLFEGLNVEVNDLWSVSRALPQEAHSDSVHFQTELGIEALGRKVVECIMKKATL